MRLLREYRLEFIEKKKEEVHIRGEWEEVFQKIQKILDYYECEIPELDPFSDQFNIDLIQKYIESYLIEDEPYPELWKKLLIYSESSGEIGYGKIRHSHSLKIMPKHCRLEQQHGAWVWEHKDEVEAFMTDPKKKYEKLELIARLFPIHIDY